MLVNKFSKTLYISKIPYKTLSISLKFLSIQNWLIFAINKNKTLFKNFYCSFAKNSERIVSSLFDVLKLKKLRNHHRKYRIPQNISANTISQTKFIRIWTPSCWGGVSRYMFNWRRKTKRWRPCKTFASRSSQ